MRIIAKRTLRQFWEGSPELAEAEMPLRHWFTLTARADWATPAAVKTQFRNASILQGNRVVFNISGNKYRLVVKINYPYRVVYVRFIGTHAQYDMIDAETV